MLVLIYESDCLQEGLRTIGGKPSVEFFRRDPSPYLREFRRKNYEQLGRQARPGIKPGTSRLPVLRAEQLCHWWGDKIQYVKRVFEDLDRVHLPPTILHLFYK